MNTHTLLKTALLLAGTLSTAGLSAQNWLTAGNVVGAADVFGSTNNADVRFISNGVDRVRILAAGNVGVGLVAAPVAQLEVGNTFRVSSNGFPGRHLRIESNAFQQIIAINDFVIGSDFGSMVMRPGLLGGVRNFRVQPGGVGPDLLLCDGTLNFVGIGGQPSAKFQVIGGQVSQLQFGTFGNFAAGNEWLALGQAGSPAMPIPSVYGLGMADNGFAGYYNIVDNGATKDLVIGYGNDGAAADAAQRLRIRNIRTNGMAAPVNKDLMVFNAAGYVGINNDPGVIAFLVDATPAVVPSPAAFRAITVLTNGSFAVPAAATFSSIGQEGNSTIIPGTDITGLRAQNGNAGLNCQVNASVAEITWQDLNFAGAVSTATAAQDRITFNFRNNQPANNAANKKEVMTILANGRVGINTAAPVAMGTFNVAPSPAGMFNFFLDVNGGVRAQGYFAFSDQRFKSDIKTIENPMERIMKMRGASYIFNAPGAEEGTPGVQQIGFIAQELELVVPEAVAKGDDGIYAVNYGAITPLLVEGMKVQQQQITTQQAEINALKAEIAAMKGSTITNDGVQAPLEVNPALGSLQQNVPNPFNQQTVINFNVAQNAGVASMIIYDLNGRQIRAEQLNQRGAGQFVINANELAPGMYIYTLIVDGKAADSKRMIVTE
ncbi:MAG: tail fiber domain-containing protein [Bacteroidetes bacterium]|nr:tail fiber domain-containing protein [Bacteroidota bacterium]